MRLTHETLVNYFVDHHDITADELTNDTTLFTSSLLDSFAMVDLILFIEKEAGIRIAAAEVTLDNVDTIGSILRFVETKLSNAARVGSGNR
jgi:acyl carrier protein